HDIGQDPDGFLWVATWEGTARFDGLGFTPVRGLHEAAGGRLASRLVWRDDDGSMLVAIDGPGLLRASSDRAPGPACAGTAELPVARIAAAAGGGAWPAAAAGPYRLPPGGRRARDPGGAAPAGPAAHAPAAPGSRPPTGSTGCGRAGAASGCRGARAWPGARSTRCWPRTTAACGWACRVPSTAGTARRSRRWARAWRCRRARSAHWPAMPGARPGSPANR